MPSPPPPAWALLEEVETEADGEGSEWCALVGWVTPPGRGEPEVGRGDRGKLDEESDEVDPAFLL